MYNALIAQRNQEIKNTIHFYVFNFFINKSSENTINLTTSRKFSRVLDGMHTSQQLFILVRARYNSILLIFFVVLSNVRHSSLELLKS